MIATLIETTGGRRGVVREMIGRTSTATNGLWALTGRTTVDETLTDYAFYDKLRRCKVPGYELSGLLCEPLVQIIASGVLGAGISAELEKSPDDPEDPDDPVNYTNRALAAFFERHQTMLAGMYRDLLALGDQYIVVNADGSLSVVSPDTIKLTHNYPNTTPVAVEITGRYDGLTITDVYTDTGRVYVEQRGGQRSVTRFPLLLGEIPVVHFCNDAGANEIYGRSLFEPLLRLLDRYDTIIEKMLDGVELIGNPIPTFEGMDDIAETKAANLPMDTETVPGVDTVNTDREVIEFDRLSAVMVGKGGSFRFVSPGNVTANSRDALKALFLLLLDHTRIPEAVWGNELSSARASATVQMGPFGAYLSMRRNLLEGDAEQGRAGLKQLAGLWLKGQAVTDKRLITDQPLRIVWPETDAVDQGVMIQWVNMLLANAAITRQTALRVSGLVTDAQAEIEQVDAENTAAQEDQLNYQALLSQAAAEANQMNGKEGV